MAKKEFKFYGLSLDQVKALSDEEFLALIPSRSRRSLKRRGEFGFSAEAKKVLKAIEKGSKKIRTHQREMIIIPKMIGHTIEVYTGKAWERIEISPDMLGHRLGEFALTRKKVAHSSPGVGATRSSAALSVR
ncbi:30S ribosomal protein S19 [Candidatus Woesearchaeota archaeon]|nr:30S ribosomal protein S19 [Candidatus Woesearchaeota archaeon]